MNSIACPLLKSCVVPETTTPLSVTSRAPAIVAGFIGGVGE